MYTNLEGRGSALYVKDSIQSCELKYSAQCRAAVWCEIKLRELDKLVIGVIYRSPNCTDDENSQLLSMVTQAVSSKPCHLMIMGDFNFPGIDWNSHSGSQHHEEVFLNSFRDLFLWQHSEKPTHYREGQTVNILDLVFTSEEEMIDKINYCEPIGKSDHLTLD